MQVFLTLLRRELGTFFVSLSGYVIIATATFLMGACLSVMIHMLGTSPWPLSVTELFFSTFYLWLILLLTTPAITMRLFALEKFTGTFETLMTTPVSDFQVVTAKFAAAWTFYLLMGIPMMACCFVIQHFAHQPGALDPGTIGGTYLGMGLIGALFISIGCFASALTNNQIVAAMITLVLDFALFAAANLAERLSAGTDWQTRVLELFALFQQTRDYAHGIIDTRSVVFLASLTFFFLFLTLRAVESRRWK